jgi:DNA-binding NarL/FixJ family response regulator
MPTIDGIEATRRIARAGTTRVVILTTFDLDEYVYDALRAGASGFLLKDSKPDQLIAAIHAVADGQALIEPGVTRRLLDEFARRPPARAAADALAALTARERDISWGWPAACAMRRSPLTCSSARPPSKSMSPTR